MWKKEKSEREIRINELQAYADKIKYDGHENIENYKAKYNDYKTKLKKANISLQTLTTRLAKQELMMAAEREIGRVDSMRVPGAHLGSDFSGAPNVMGGQRIPPGGIRSTGSALSPNQLGQNYDQFNIADYNVDLENQELNEEIKKLLMEN